MGEWGFTVFLYTPSDLMGRETFQQKSHFRCYQVDFQSHEDFSVFIMRVNVRKTTVQ